VESEYTGTHIAALPLIHSIRVAWNWSGVSVASGGLTPGVPEYCLKAPR
jgi:hypothetical protein